MGKATTLIKEIEINASKEKVWEAIADFGNICHASPIVSTSHVTSELKEGIGATRHCDFTMMGAKGEERVVKWEEGKLVKLEVYELQKMPGIDKMSAEFEVISKGDKVVLRGTMEYTMKNGFFDFVNSLMMIGMNSKSWTGVMAGHKKYIETGERVFENTVLELNKVVSVN
jgi:hypothetical protein